MPTKIKHAFEKEYGKKKGRLIFYKWRSKHKSIDGHVKKNMTKFK